MYPMSPWDVYGVLGEEFEEVTWYLQAIRAFLGPNQGALMAFCLTLRAMDRKSECKTPV